MSFKYALTAAQQTPTSDSKAVLCKSFKIDIANGAGFTTATAYDLGWLPKEAQVVDMVVITQTAVSGGTVSVATLAVTGAGSSLVSGVNVFAAGVSRVNSVGYYSSAGGFQATSTDQLLQYTPTLTGAGATAGVIYINVFYVI